jgi:hypothetical protein
MTKAEALSHFKTVAALAEAAGCTPGAVSQWAAIPWDRQMRLETVTKKKLRADPNPRLSDKVSA